MGADLPRILDLLASKGAHGALATLVAIEGSAYRRPGARLAWLTDGCRAGGISGGCVEEDLLEHAREVATSGSARHVSYHTDADGEALWGVGTGCDGRIDIILEPLEPVAPLLTGLPAAWQQGLRPRLILDWRNPGPDCQTRLLTGHEETPSDPRVFFEQPQPPPELWLFGAGDDVRPLATMAHTAGFRIHIFDTRPALLTSARFPGSSLHHRASDAPFSFPRPWGAVAAVVMSHRIDDDVEALAALASVPFSYLGVLGAKRRCARLADALAARCGAALADRLFATARAPVGLHLGGEGPEAIALSILAEIQAVLNDGEGVPLSHRDRPIHAPLPNSRPSGASQ
ncbi:XdhC family protein [Nibricoccus sp. IMCC34717]|uniref:XdhC family protein n=1 Tax=Nibricoccus sp. IMCC34717 TaxID=3034021 RepID=UPI00384D1E65